MFVGWSKILILKRQKSVEDKGNVGIEYMGWQKFDNVGRQPVEFFFSVWKKGHYGLLKMHIYESLAKNIWLIFRENK